MGDRGNVFIRGSSYDYVNRRAIPATAGIWIYGHWSGYNFPIYVREALRKAGNYGVSVARMLDEETDGRTWEVSLEMQDNEYPIVFVDNHNQRVGFSPEPVTYCEAPPEPETWIPFSEFTKMDNDTIRSLRDAVKLRG